MEVSIDYLREALAYDPATGKIVWLARPVGHFVSEIARRKVNTLRSGKEAGLADRLGYRRIELRFAGKRVVLTGSRVGWALMTGRWPPHDIDHIDGNPRNDRFDNLRLATRGQNQQNHKMNCRNTSGYRGVTWNARQKRWMAQIAVARQYYYLGYFDDPKEASAAYLVAKARLHTFQPVPRA